jgi:UDP-N-acetyl-D-mannosaminuronic acid transferase (WecB/TagA/CpsF family)
MPHSSITLLGVPFFNGSLTQALELARTGGLLVAPSGPGLAWDLIKNPAYREAVSTADIALADSGFMVLLSRILPGCGTPARLSGLRFLEALLEDSGVQAPGASFWLMPSELEQTRNLNWLQKHGFPHLTEADCHLAPHYPRLNSGVIQDQKLLATLEERRPQWVILNVGSGVQEPLGAWLRSELSYHPALICTGAAIAFKTGGQAPIPVWADRLFLGWLLRILHQPKGFLPRYLKATRLAYLMARWKQSLPPMQEA